MSAIFRFSDYGIKKLSLYYGYDILLPSEEARYRYTKVAKIYFSPRATAGVYLTVKLQIILNSCLLTRGLCQKGR